MRESVGSFRWGFVFRVLSQNFGSFVCGPFLCFDLIINVVVEKVDNISHGDVALSFIAS